MYMKPLLEEDTRLLVEECAGHDISIEIKKSSPQHFYTNDKNGKWTRVEWAKVHSTQVPQLKLNFNWRWKKISATIKGQRGAWLLSWYFITFCKISLRVLFALFGFPLLGDFTLALPFWLLILLISAKARVPTSKDDRLAREKKINNFSANQTQHESQVQRRGVGFSSHHTPALRIKNVIYTVCSAIRYEIHWNYGVLQDIC